ncbi:carboxypeptidase-like regulatory domain-containing protein [Dactylosporangium sp. NBC_01737]|uniref:carboxypeptidase-like regulatory domain-containing protein n=1 Tax=Dactylosporangium sp. NBC_01737 TaxID=2975959 RepID=UPI002E150F63|nr:carboxypeptidase-like regulatory domain-containing protein [Dactylosporangium sp. NBC_01737]
MDIPSMPRPAARATVVALAVAAVLVLLPVRAFAAGTTWLQRRGMWLPSPAGQTARQTFHHFRLREAGMAHAPRRLMVAAVVGLFALLPAQPAGAAGPGAVAGSLTEAGAPVPGATVSLLLNAYPVSVAAAVTGADGTFRLDGVAPGTYKLKFSLLGGLEQFYPGRPDFASGASITVTDGQTTGGVTDTVVAHGSLAGHVTTATGVPAAHALVGIARPASADLAHVLTDAGGGYLLPYVAAGTYQQFVSAAERGAPRQWVRGHKRAADADPVTVALGRRTTVDEALLPLGTISGRLGDAAGPVASPVVTAYSQSSPAENVAAPGQPDGTFRMFVYPGTYKVKFTAPAGHGLDQWSHGKESERTADVVTVAAGAGTVLDERQLPTGTVRGRLTDATGNPVAGGGVVVADPARDRQFQATTAADGTWFLTAWTGSYRVSFSTATQKQWAPGAATPADAAMVTVTGGGTTVVDDALTVPGSVAVTAVDARTGGALSTFCAETVGPSVFLPPACTQTGTVTFPDVGAGPLDVKVTDGVHLDATVSTRVAAGRRTGVTARLDAGATIAFTLVDAVTGAPVDGCVNLVPTTRVPDPDGGYAGDCGSGTITLNRVHPEPYAVFAGSFDGTHGAQWVGPHGGVGSRAAALVVAPAAGGTAAVTVRYDGTRTITGTVTDRAGGAPVADATVSTYVPETRTDATGHYTIDRLGPYRWTLAFTQPAYAGQVSSQYTLALHRGTTVTGRITGAFGGTPESATVSVVDARTLDVVSQVDAAADGTYVAHVTPSERVRVVVRYTLHSCPGNATSRDTQVHRPATVNLTVPEPCGV